MFPSYTSVETVAIYMVLAPTRVLKEGRVTIPADVRRELDLTPGDYVLVDVQGLEGGGSDG